MVKEQKEERQRKVRSDAGIPRLFERDIKALQWIGDMGAANVDILRDLLGRLSDHRLEEEDRLSATRVRHILEDRWLPARVVEADHVMGKKWVWLTRRGLNRVKQPFSPHRPADVTANHLHQINRIRLDLEAAYPISGSWESARWIERNKKLWKTRKKETSTVIPDEYETWHMPDALWTFRNDGETSDQRVFIEVELSSKGIERTAEIMLNLARHGTTWYFVDTNPKKHVYETLMEALNGFTGPQEQYKSCFYFYDLANPDKLLFGPDD